MQPKDNFAGFEFYNIQKYSEVTYRSWLYCFIYHRPSKIEPVTLEAVSLRNYLSKQIASFTYVAN